MDLSFHSQQFGNIPNAKDDTPLPRLSHARLMAIVNGKASLAMARGWQGRAYADRSDPHSMDSRRSFFAPSRGRPRDYAASAWGSFSPGVAEQTALVAASANYERTVYQAGSAIGKKQGIETSCSDDDAATGEQNNAEMHDSDSELRNE